MKLKSKVTLSNLFVNAIFTTLAALALYFIVRSSVFKEMDQHLLNHKQDVISSFKSGDISPKSVKELGALGTYEWIELHPFKGNAEAVADSFKTVQNTRFEDQNPSTYRQLKSVISINGSLYTLIIYEEVTGWHKIASSIIVVISVLLLVWFIMLYIGNHIVISSVLKPFFRTISKLKGIQSESDFHVTFPAVDIDEINELNGALNSMLKELESSFEEQKQFIQNASHELLTPLAIIRQKTDDLINSPYLGEREFIQLAQIQQTINRLSKLSNALLLISRVESKQYPLKDYFDLYELVADIHTELDDFIGLKNLSVQNTIAKGINIKGNKELVHSLFYNIIQNAIYYSPEGSEIAFSASKKASHLDVAIADEGSGIPEEDRERIFARFEKSGSKKSNSPGLGLSIVKSISSLHGWNSYVDSGKEKGSVFHIIIPLEE